jgi:hypothetical protein
MASDHAALMRTFDVMARLRDLDAPPMKRLIADALACPGVDPEDDDDKESDVDPGACGAD